MNTITEAHVRQAIDWAMGNGTLPSGIERTYDQATVDCGSSCCIWGAAHLIAEMPGLAEMPTSDTALGDELRLVIAVRLMRSSTAAPEHIRAALDGECDDRGNWRCSDCVDCSRCARCSGCARCSACSDCSGCWECSGCSGCSRCSDCSDCVDCSYAAQWAARTGSKTAAQPV